MAPEVHRASSWPPLHRFRTRRPAPPAVRIAQMLVVLLLIATVLACGGRTSDAPASTAGAPDAGSDADAVSSCPDGKVDAEPYTGFIKLSWLPDALAPYWVEGGFSETQPNDPTVCSNGVSGDPCCFVPNRSIGIALPAFVPTAGQLSVYDGSALLASLEAGDYLESSEFASSLRWERGDTLTLSASGAEVAAFRTSIVAPALPVILSPSFSPSPRVEMSGASDFVVTWASEGFTCDKMMLMLTSPSIGSAYCTVEDAAGSITVSGSIMSQLVAQNVSVSLLRVRSSYFHGSNVNLQVDATSRHVTFVNVVP